MSVRFSRCEISFTLFLAIFLGASITIAAMAVDMSYSIGEVLSSTPSMTIVDGIRCDTMEFTMFHIHAHLDIFVDGTPFTVPSQIGIDPEGRCLYWLHTHDDSGIIHIESQWRDNLPLEILLISGPGLLTTHSYLIPIQLSH